MIKKSKPTSHGALSVDSEVVKRISADPFSFISRLKIVDKRGKIVPLTLNGEQKKIIETLEEGEPLLILKGRQIGSSTVVCGYYFWKIWCSQDPMTHVIMTHKLQSSKQLLKIFKTMYENLPTPLKRELSVINSTEMRFSSGAGVVAQSAGGEGGLRSFTCSSLHISEYAFAPNPEELKATAISALNEGQLVIESTANHWDDALHREIISAQRGESRWNYLFFPWFEHREYCTTHPSLKEEDLSEYEREIKCRWGLSLGQIEWRREREGKLGRDKFRREYPLDINDAYSMTGNTWLIEDDIKHIETLQVHPITYNELSPYSPSDVYSIGVDTSGGTGGDWSTVVVLSKRTGQPVAIWRDNRTSPVELAGHIERIGTKWGKALVLVESNNYGHVVINELGHLGYTALWKDEGGKDWSTTSKSRTIALEGLRSALKEGRIHTLDNITLSELRGITVDPLGHIELNRTGGTHCDNVVALALALKCSEKVKLRNDVHLPEWVKKSRGSLIKARSGMGTGLNRKY
jgi:hypothetical protein